MSSNANRRTDQYGSSIGNRVRFPLEVATAVAEEIGSGRTGFRISPGNPFNDVVEHDVDDLYGHLVPALAPLGLAYLHVAHRGSEALLKRIRDDWPLNEPAPTTFYGGHERGYTDYPALARNQGG